MTNEPVLVDYLTVTWIIDERSEAVFPHFHAKVHQGDRVHMRGFRGYIKDKLFFGRSDDLFMLQATGGRADEIMREYDFRVFNGCSFARIDLQITVDVPNADHIILFTRPNKLYKATLTYDLNGPGATLYVGAPSSRARLRVYNKSAESGLKPDQNHDWLRVELQLRDSYADRAATYYYSDQVAQFFRTYVTKMSDAFITDIVDRFINSDERLPPLPDDNEQDWVARRYAWLEDTVRPAIIKLSLYDPGGVSAYLKSLLDKINVDDV